MSIENPPTENPEDFNNGLDFNPNFYKIDSSFSGITPSDIKNYAITYPTPQDALITFPNSISVKSIESFSPSFDIGIKDNASMRIGTTTGTSGNFNTITIGSSSSDVLVLGNLLTANIKSSNYYNDVSIYPNVRTGNIKIGEALEETGKLTLGSTNSTTTIPGNLETLNRIVTSGLLAPTDSSSCALFNNLFTNSIYLGNALQAGHKIQMGSNNGNVIINGLNIQLGTGTLNSVVKCVAPLLVNNIDVLSGTFLTLGDNTDNISIGSNNTNCSVSIPKLSAGTDSVAVTQSAGDNTTKLATTAFVQGEKASPTFTGTTTILSLKTDEIQRNSQVANVKLYTASGFGINLGTTNGESFVNNQIKIGRTSSTLLIKSDTVTIEKNLVLSGASSLATLPIVKTNTIRGTNDGTVMSFSTVTNTTVIPRLLVTTQFGVDSELSCDVIKIGSVNSTAKTAPVGDSSTKIATTAFVGGEINAFKATANTFTATQTVSELSTNTISNSNLTDAVSVFTTGTGAITFGAASRALTIKPGTVTLEGNINIGGASSTAQTQDVENNSTRIATTAFVKNAIAGNQTTFLASSPTFSGTLTATELSTNTISNSSLVNPVNLYTTGTGVITFGAAARSTTLKSGSVYIDGNMYISGALSTAHTQGVGNNSTRIATTAFVQGEKASPTFTGTTTTDIIKTNSLHSLSSVIDLNLGTVDTQNVNLGKTGQYLTINSQQTKLGTGAPADGCLSIHATESAFRNCIRLKSAWDGQMYYIQFTNQNGDDIGAIGNYGSGVNYMNYSDRRLKEDIVPMDSTLDKIMLLKPSKYKWKSTGDTGVGFIAQEVFQQFPEMRTCVPKATNPKCDCPVDEDGNPVYHGLDYGKFTPQIIKAIQEMKTMYDDKIAVLEQRLFKLENQN